MDKGGLNFFRACDPGEGPGFVLHIQLVRDRAPEPRIVGPNTCHKGLWGRFVCRHLIIEAKHPAPCVEVWWIVIRQDAQKFLAPVVLIQANLVPKILKCPSCFR